MQDHSPLNNKPLDVHIRKRLVFTIFYTNGGLFRKVLNSFSFSQKNCAQNGYFGLHKLTSNNMDISTHTTSKIKPDTLVCFLNLLQEYLILSTYPFLKIKMKKVKLHNLSFLFLVSWKGVYPQTTKILFHISKICSSLQFYTLTDEHLHWVKYCFSIRQKFCTQIGCLLLHKSTFNNTDISTHTTLKIKLGYRVCFAKLLQEYLLQSTHPSLKFKMK